MPKLIGRLSAGHARCVQPIAPTTIETSGEGLLVGAIEVPTLGGDVAIPAYRAQPGGPGPHPLVLVVHEIFGVHEYIQDVCRRLAHEGYLAVAPELFVRYGDVSLQPDLKDTVLNVVRFVPDAEVMADLDACVRWGAASGDADPNRLAITGFCWGGRTVWLYAAHNPSLRAGIAWYGRLVGDASEKTPRHPLQLANSLHAPVLGLYGEKDAAIPLESVALMREALAARADASEFVIYPDAPHGFHSDYRESFRKDAAEDGWRRMLAWF
jgi:carboxymethylenebutenolidase